MKVLVTGGTGVVGRPAVSELVQRGHSVRLLSRHAERDARGWGAAVEPHPGSVADAAAVRGAAAGCDAVLHIAGIAREQPPEITFDGVNVEGTRLLLAEAERSGVRRFVFVSSLGAERGQSEYHQSKSRAEQLVRGFAGDWLILRPGNVYGPGDEVVSLLLKMVRAMPAVPLVGEGDQPMQPVAAPDVGRALALAVEREDLQGVELALAGPDLTSMRELVEMIGEMEGKQPLGVPVPEWLASIGTDAAQRLGADLPVTHDQITMLLEGNFLRPEQENALVTVFGVQPMTLHEGLAWLADSMPEESLRDGSGPLERQRYWADISGAALSADALFEIVRREFATLPDDELMRVDCSGGEPPVLAEGVMLRMHVPLRGTLPVRVEEVRERTATLATLDGHALFGAIRFSVEESHDTAGEPLLRFEVRSYTRGATPLDQLVVRTAGAPLQRATWRSVVEAVIRRSGGTATDGVQHESELLEADAAADVEAWAARLVDRRRSSEGEQPHNR